MNIIKAFTTFRPHIGIHSVLIIDFTAKKAVHATSIQGATHIGFDAGMRMLNARNAQWIDATPEALTIIEEGKAA